MTNRPFFTFPTIASTCAGCTSLGIVYHPDGSLREYSFSKIPPSHIFIDPQIIADAPAPLPVGRHGGHHGQAL